MHSENAGSQTWPGAHALASMHSYPQAIVGPLALHVRFAAGDAHALGSSQAMPLQAGAQVHALPELMHVRPSTQAPPGAHGPHCSPAPGQAGACCT